MAEQGEREKNKNTIDRASYLKRDRGRSLGDTIPGGDTRQEKDAASLTDARYQWHLQIKACQGDGPFQEGGRKAMDGVGL